MRLVALLLLVGSTAWAGLTPVGANIAIISQSDPLRDFHTPAVVANTTDDQIIYLWNEDDGTGRYGVRVAGLTFEQSVQVTFFPVAVDIAGTNTRHVDAAYNPVDERTLIVWEEADTSASGAYEIWGRLMERDYSFVGDPFRISSAGTTDAQENADAGQPDVAANIVDGGFVVVWHADDFQDGTVDGEFRIFARRIDGDGALYGSANDAVSSLTGGTLPSARAPAIAFDDLSQSYLLAYEAHDVGASAQPRIRATRLDSDAAPNPSFADVLVGTPTAPVQLERNPDVAYDSRGNRFLVGYDVVSVEASGSPISRIVAARVDFAAALPLVDQDVVVYTIPVGTGGFARDPSVAYSFATDNFTVAWSTAPGVPSDYESTVVAREVSRDGVVGTALLPVADTSSATVGYRPQAVSPIVIADPSEPLLYSTWSGSLIGDFGNFGIFGQMLSQDVATSTPSDRRPERLALAAAPNPFNPATAISFALPQDGRARVTIHDVRGQRVRVLVDENLSAGVHERTWNGTDHNGRAVASGIYFARIEHAGTTVNRKLTLVK